MVVLVVTGAVALVGADVPGERRGGTAGDTAATDVELPDRADLPDPMELPAADPPEGTALEESDPVRAELDCAPEGCERWRRSLTGLRAAWYDGDVVVALVGPDLVALDTATGEDRWSLPVADHVQVGPAERAVWRHATITGDDRWLAVVGAAGIQVVTRSGETAWTATFPEDESLHVAWVVHDVVVLATERWPPPAGDGSTVDDGAAADGGEVDAADPWGVAPAVRLTAYDVTTGDVRWSRDDLTEVAPSPPGLRGSGPVLARTDDGGYVALDPASGQERYRLGAGSDRWLYQVGGYVVAGFRGARDGGRTTVHAADDGRELAELPDGELGWAIDVEGLLVAVHRPLSPPRDPQVVALDAAGAMVWSTVLGPAAGACCPSVLDTGDGVLLASAGHGGDVHHLDLRSGVEVGRTAVGRSSAAPGASADEWQLARDLTIRTSTSGDRLTVRDARGREVEARGDFVHPLTDAGGWAARDGRLLLWAEQELLAVDLPPS